MSHQLLEHFERDASIEELRGEGMPQAVRRVTPGDASIV